MGTRRVVSILLVLVLVLGAFALGGCATGCPGICQPDGTYEYVVSERCFPVDQNLHPVYRDP